MEIHKPFIIFPVGFLLLFSLITTILVVNGQILPIANGHGGNTTKYQAYIVHVQKPKGRKFQTFRDRKDWYMSFLPNTTIDSEEPRMIYTYRRAINGFAAMLTQAELEVIRSKSGFLLAHEDREIQLRTTYTPKFLGLDRSGGLMYDSSYGNGQIIGMIDSGIKYDHPSFHDQGMPPPPPRWHGDCYWKKNGCNNKLIGAVGFKHGLVVSPIDNNGHGTHTASTAAGNFVPDVDILGNAKGTASGTAPGAHLAVYGGGTSKDALKGIDEAIRDGVDVLSMSLGFSSPTTFDKDVIAVASFAAVTEKIVPVQAGGNAGPFFGYVDGAPWILMAGSSTTDRTITAVVKLGDGREFYGESAYQPSNFPPTQLPLVYPYDILNTDDSKTCKGNSLNSLDVKGKIVLCGSTAVYTGNLEAGERVKKAGGAAVIIMSQPWDGNRTDADAHFLPASRVPFNASMQIINYWKTATTPTATIIFKGTKFGFRPAPTVSSSSSRGPNLLNGNIIKPDIIAPGSNILAAWPKEVGPNPTGTKKTFVMLSGTSMAAPHVSGIVALLKHNHPDWSAAAIQSAIMTTASTTDNEGNPIKDQWDGNNAGAFAMGSGQVNPTAADKPGLIYDIEPHDYIRYLCGMKTLSDKQVSAIVRGPITCSQVHSIDAEQLNYPSISVSLGPSSMMKTINRTVTSVVDGSSSYTVKFDNPEGVNVHVNPDILKFSQRDEKQDFMVTLSIQGIAPKAGKFSEGKLLWDSGKYLVRSPIIVTFT